MALKALPPSSCWVLLSYPLLRLSSAQRFYHLMSGGWVECSLENCKKWRRYPDEQEGNINSTLEWDCSMNTWDDKFAKCAAKQQCEGIVSTTNNPCSYFSRDGFQTCSYHSSQEPPVGDAIPDDVVPIACLHSDLEAVCGKPCCFTSLYCNDHVSQHCRGFIWELTENEYLESRKLLHAMLSDDTLDVSNVDSKVFLASGIIRSKNKPNSIIAYVHECFERQ